MKVRVVENPDLEDDVVIQYRVLTPAIEAAILHLNHLEIDVIDRGANQKIAIHEIIFFESEDDKVYAHTRDKHYGTRYKLYELEERLPSSFVRTSKSSIVNAIEIEGVERSIGASSVLRFFKTHKIAYVSRLYYGPLKRKLEERGLK